MNRLQPLLCSLAWLALLAGTAARAQSQRTQPCSFNGGRWIQVRHVDMGPTFRLEWSDGPRMTYTWVGSTADRHNLTDSLGGAWHYSDQKNGRGFSLSNLSNGNRIVCD